MKHSEFMKTAPAVLAVGNEYQIMVPVNYSAILWVQVGNRKYYDDSNGIFRSDTDMHRVCVPMSALDDAEEYTIYWREVMERKPYSPILGEEQSARFAFRPLKNDPIRMYMISDAHGMLEQPVAAGKKFIESYGGIDLLVLNGDILSNSGDSANFILYYQIIEALTGGEVPAIISRGNHDLRGKCAERLVDYMPGQCGRSYYTVRLGKLWAILLDLGEDKEDAHKEYNGTICCQDFRLRETEFFEQVAENGAAEYAADGVEHRIVISHVPFTRIDMAPVEEEQALYRKWVELLNEKINPEFILSGHTHWQYIAYPGEKYDSYGMRFPTVVGAYVDRENPYFAGCGIIWKQGGLRVIFNDGQEILKDQII
ncbi:MAG: metallophosphoesterase [Ruminococcaceae bacterium]|nr:metallophosphoesterase [Oscillospiraceae bacterium]